MFKKGRQLFELRSLAGIDEQRGAREVAFAGRVQFGKNGNEINGQIIDAIKAHVFERFEYSALSGAGKSGENDKLARFASRGLLHRTRPLSFLPGADGCWGCAYLRGILRRCGGCRGSRRRSRSWRLVCLSAS